MEDIAKRRASRRAYYHRHKERLRESERERKRLYSRIHRETENARSRRFQKRHRKKTQELRRIRRNRRYKRDALYRARERLRSRAITAITRARHKKRACTLKLLGASWPIILNHLETQFRSGMTWDTYGKWEIDHIIPLASAKTIEELERLIHYTNLQPLWAEENRRKGATLPQGHPV